MRNCPKCKEMIEDNMKFCPFCGESIIEADKSKRQKWAIIFITSLVVLFFAENIYNIIYETKMSKPFNSSGMFGDTRVDFSGHYNKQNKDITLFIGTDQIIEQWQVDAVKNKKEALRIILPTPEGEKILECDSITLKNKEALSGTIFINNAGLKEYAKLKNYFVTNINKVTISYDNSLCFRKDERKQAKKEYFAEKERKRQQEIARQNLYNFYNYGYYGY